MFDPNEFLNQSLTDANDTKLIPVPDNMSGEGYIAIADKVEIRSWQKKDDPSVSGLALDIIWDIQDEGVKAAVGREKVSSKQGIMLDLTDSGQLDMAKGKNIGLGKLREALDMNTHGQAFSFAMISGRMAKVFVQHRVVGEDVYAEVKRVGKL